MNFHNNKSAHSGGLPTELLRRYALILLADCAGGSTILMREQIRLAATHTDLVKLRSGIFESMIKNLGEAEAMERIRSFDLSA